MRLNYKARRGSHRFIADTLNNRIREVLAGTGVITAVVGNGTDVLVNGVPLAHYDYDAANQVLGWTYDAVGNGISDTARSYTYDALNRLTGLSEGLEQRLYAYNGDGVVAISALDVVLQH